VVETTVFGTAGTIGNVMRSAGRVVIKVEVEMENLQALMRRCSIVGYHDLFLHDLEINHDLFLRDHDLYLVR
jgi:hypothetical protein